ncbi:MAG TPA: gliding motility-associated C-terminal domain-containing protein [Saprospiraceae bacterium]|nr:gliding motility-associated C-terminal domain-containing protein [Saprospiraceae bacterium]
MKYGIYLSLLVIGIFASCKDDVMEEKTCCSIPAVDTQVGNGHVYVPNIFTPEGDGKNDFWTVFVDDSIALIQSMEVTDKDGKVVFSALNVFPYTPETWWDGRFNGQKIEGVFEYSVVVRAANGIAAQLFGEVCNHPCEQGSIPISGSGCQFPLQNDVGHYNGQLASQESSDCFE